MGKALSKVVELCEAGLRPGFLSRFEEEGHQYYLSKVPGEWVNVPSVTQVVDQLHNFTGFPGKAAARGTLIHKACELFILGTLDWTSVDDSILKEVQTFAAWWEQARFKPLIVEGIVGSWRYKFAGRLDLFGIWKTGLVLVDFKTGGEYPAYAVQTAGLEIALREMVDSTPCDVVLPPIQRCCLYLDAEKARPKFHDSPRNRTTFLSALECSHFRREAYP